MKERIGTCSLCAGPVVVSEGSDHPIPHCQRCGATQKLPVLQMEQPSHRLPYLEDIRGSRPSLPPGNMTYK